MDFCSSTLLFLLLLHIHMKIELENPDGRKSTFGFAIFLGNSNLLVYMEAIVRSSTRAEYRALAATTTEALSISHFLHEI